MATLFLVLTIGLDAVVFIAVGILLLEIMTGAFFGGRRVRSTPLTFAGRVAVVVPAHNESGGILPTIQDILLQLKPGDQVVVVADNCSDDTASVARSAGAEVVERNEPHRRGKGFALERGVQVLRSAPPDVVVIVDADCRLASGALDRLAGAAQAANRPVQADYRMQAPHDAPIQRRVAEFAWIVKNFARPLGLYACGLPCQLMGSGMAFPWTVIASARLGTAHIVEDVKLGLELAQTGHAPLFCPSAVVSSEFPTSEAAAEGQKKRWEFGQLALFFSDGLRSLPAALRSRNVDLMSMVADLAVPPLSLLVLGLLLSAAASGLAFALTGRAGLLAFGAANVLMFGAAIATAWIAYGRQSLPGRMLLAVPPYLARKLWFYLRMARQRGPLGWNRTERSGR